MFSHSLTRSLLIRSSTQPLIIIIYSFIHSITHSLYLIKFSVWQNIPKSVSDEYVSVVDNDGVLRHSSNMDKAVEEVVDGTRRELEVERAEHHLLGR